MRAADVKKVAKSAGLVYASEKLPANLGELVDLLWKRALERRHDLYPERREAAE
jgi:hypothetical protein